MGKILIGHVLDKLKELDDESVHCCITSPPYLGLRDYDTEPQIWGGVNNCDHEWGEAIRAKASSYLAGYDNEKSTLTTGTNQARKKELADTERDNASTGQFCARCGAWRGQLGLEPTPSAYIEHLVEVFREVKRVLRKDGTCWLNLGDSYAGSGKGAWDKTDIQKEVYVPEPGGPQTKCKTPGLKPKDLCMIPARVALALQADGWWVRSDIIWEKDNAMPESCFDRPTKSHEYIFLLTKSARYFYDADAVREENTCNRRRGPGNYAASFEARGMGGGHTGLPNYEANPAGRNLRDVWTFPTQPYPEAHFSTFPPELPRKCIRAGSPVKVCSKCREGWDRIVELGELKDHPQRENRNVEAKQFHGEGYGDGGTLGKTREIKTTGFIPSCNCYPKGKEETLRAIILDPFAGSGTTGAVAVEEGRDYIMVELNPDYKPLIEKRIRKSQMGVTIDF